ncbi:hypothetical protein HEP86_01930 [Streptomyces sp. RPA4-5]|uniref:hypothetical protein n=1 Tax=Streptomyces sp. RPA4-5 TaxID=2721245 RepID=UPI00143E5E31|nr:hypothetical protein [Streptomyces sp. RPA4-5]QIY53482.1 hypothetical protein HEP86_01930 [Streptomyces sp. RPA4-5]
MTADHTLVLELLHASHAAAQREAPVHRDDDPACQVVLRAAKADADDGGMERLTLLALGTAVCASDLTAVLAEHKNITTQQLIDELVAARRNQGAEDTAMPDLLLAMRTDDPGQAAELLGNLIAGDHDAFLDLIVELGDYAATCVSLLAALEISPVEETLAQLEETVQQFITSKRPPRTGTTGQRQ